MPYLKPDQEVPTKGKGSKLTAKMERFIDEYFVDFNGSEAILRAGYVTRNPNRMAAELMRHPLVSEEIERRKKDLADATEIQAAFLLNKLIKIINDTEDKKPDTALRAIQLAGQSIALWKDRTEISGPDGEAIKTEQKIEQDVSDFTSSLSRLARGKGEGNVVELAVAGAKTKT